MLNALCVGHVTHDQYDRTLVSGGSAYYTAQVFRRLGARARLATVVGTDFAADSAFAGLETVVIRRGETTRFHNRYVEGEGRRQLVGPIAPRLEPEMLPRSWIKPDVMFLAPVIGELELASWNGVQAGIIALGVQGWIKGPGSTVDERGFHRVERRSWIEEARLLSRAHVAIVSDEDLQGQPELLARLTAAIPIVVWTHGAEGCDVIHSAGQTRVGIYATDEVDPTGAGDSFSAGFLFGLASGWPLADAARLGAAVASIVIEGRAGETLHRVDQAFSRYDRIRHERVEPAK